MVVEELENERYPFFKEDPDVYFGDIADHVRKIWDGLEDCKEVVDGLAETSNWLTSHRIQEVMRVLTIIMAMMAPPSPGTIQRSSITFCPRCGKG